MNKTALAFGIGASLILAAGAANAAGTCGAEVAALQEKIGLEQGANATIGATDPGMQQPSPSASVEGGASVDGSAAVDSGTTAPMDSDQAASADNSANATTGTTTTTEDSTTTADSSSSSATTLPAPTVTETSRVGEMSTSAGGHAEAITALKKAQLAADAGNEETCMTELGAAKAALGIQ